MVTRRGRQIESFRARTRRLTDAPHFADAVTDTDNLSELANAAAAETGKLQGAWRQVRLEADGIENPPEEFDAGGTTIFSGNTFTVHNLDGSVVLAGTFSIDASANPKAIDWIDSIGPDAGKTLAAIYTLEGDSFVFIAASEGAERPTAFATKTGQTMRSFVRIPS